MVCFVSLLLVVIASGLWNGWSALANPVTILELVQVEKRPEFDNLIRLKEATAHTNCSYERVEISTVVDMVGVEEWYPKMRPVAQCRSTAQDCEEVAMTLLFLFKRYNSTIYQTYWREWNVACTMGRPSLPAQGVTLSRPE